MVYTNKINFEIMENNLNNLVSILNTSDLNSLTSAISNIELILDKLVEERTETNTKFLTSEEVCEMLQLSSRTLQKYRDEGRIRFAKLDRKIIYKLSDVEDFVEANMVETDY